jgi:hypothetical protein
MIPADAIDADLAHDVSIDPGRVTDVALVEAVD